MEAYLENGLPNKIKHFLWRAADNSHPLRSNLEFRRMDIDNRCVVCNEKGEDGGHLFFKCSRVTSIWAGLGMSSHCEHLASVESAREAVRYILGLPKLPQLTMAVGMWTWWSERNRIREEGKQRPDYVIVKLIECYTGDLVQQNAKETRTVIRTVQKWQRPAQNFLKINCDASFRRETGEGVHNPG